MVIVSVTMKYLSTVYTCNELLDIPKLLKKVAKNLPLYQLISWVYYYGSFIWGCKTAVQVGDSEYLDGMWHYSLVMYGITEEKTV